MKLYNEKEIGAILKKAAENSSGNEPDSSIGLSIHELQQLASDAGIDPDQIVKAAAEIDVQAGTNDVTFWGGPFSFNDQVMLESEIAPGEWEEMLMSIRRTFKSKGEVSTRESVLEWSSPWGSSNSAHVTALKENGTTKISVSWNGPLTALPFYIPVPLVAIASLSVASEFLELSAVPGFSFVLLATGLTFLAGRWALLRHLQKGFAKLRRMMAEFENISLKSPGKLAVKSNLNDPVHYQTANHESILDLGNEESDDKTHVQTKIVDRSRS